MALGNQQIVEPCEHAIDTFSLCFFTIVRREDNLIAMLIMVGSLPWISDRSKNSSEKFVYCGLLSNTQQFEIVSIALEGHIHPYLLFSPLMKDPFYPEGRRQWGIVSRGSKHHSPTGASLLLDESRKECLLRRATCLISILFLAVYRILCPRGTLHADSILQHCRADRLMRSLRAVRPARLK